MRFRVHETFGTDVVLASVSCDDDGNGEPSPWSGAWHIDMRRFEHFLDHGLRPLSFGDAVVSVGYDLTVADYVKWNPYQFSDEPYSHKSWNRRDRALVLTNEIEWNVVKDLGAQAQLGYLKSALAATLDREFKFRREPVPFDQLAFAEALSSILDLLSLRDVALEARSQEPG